MNRLDTLNIKYWELLFNSQEIGHKGTKDYAARCPICGDSKKNKRLKRCHLFTKDSWDHDKVHCFNCGWKGNMFSFLEAVNPHLYNAYKNEKRTQSFNSLTRPVQKKKETDINIDTSFFDDRREMPKVLFNVPEQFKEIEVGDEFYQYLKKRKMTDEHIKQFRKCNDSIIYNGEEVALKGYIVLPLWCRGKIYGFQARSIKDKRFYTFIPEQNSGFKVWNWFQIDIEKPVYVFESYFDALSSGLDNVTAQLGATLSEDRLKEASKVVFVLDNQRLDTTAREETIKYIKRGFQVMIWPNTNIKYKDFNEILVSGGSRDKISKFITQNINEGLTAEISLKV
jgi:hypothetical protein